MHLQRTPLFLACEEGHLAAAEVLMHRGADVTAHVKDHSTKKKLNCLDVAVREEHKYVCPPLYKLLCCTIKIVLSTSCVAGSYVFQ